jgi:hypothetical protein
MYDNSRKALDQWIMLVNALEVESVLAFYDEGAVLLPTFSDVLINDKEGIRGYFEKLRDENGVKVWLDEGSLMEQTLADGLHAISGIYRWRLGGDEETVVIARFTFVMDLSLSSPILHHHSSELPK